MKQKPRQQKLPFGNIKWLTGLDGQPQPNDCTACPHVKGKADIQLFIYAEAISDSKPR